MDYLTVDDLEKMIESYAGEWVLFDLLEMDESVTMPTKVEVIAHSADRDEILSLEAKLNRNTLTMYSPTEQDKNVVPMV